MFNVWVEKIVEKLASIPKTTPVILLLLSTYFQPKKYEIKEPKVICPLLTILYQHIQTDEFKDMLLSMSLESR